MIGAVLQRVLPEARVTELRKKLAVRLPGGPVTRFQIRSDPVEAAAPGEPSVLELERADPRTLELLRKEGTSFVTSSGHVFLRAPGIYIDIRPRESVADPDRMRNPFSLRGRQVCVRLLLHPERSWTITDLATVPELAAASSVSQSFASRVVASLEDQGLVQMEGGKLRPYSEALFAALVDHWPKPSSHYIGRTPSPGEAVIGGGPAYEELGLAVPAIPRIYVADRGQLRMLVMQTKSTPSPSRMAEWEAVFQPLPLRNGLVREVICALELARDPRGREVLRSHQIVPWQIYG